MKPLLWQVPDHFFWKQDGPRKLILKAVVPQDELSRPEDFDPAKLKDEIGFELIIHGDLSKITEQQYWEADRIVGLLSMTLEILLGAALREAQRRK